MYYCLDCGSHFVILSPDEVVLAVVEIEGEALSLISHLNRGNRPCSKP